MKLIIKVSIVLILLLLLLAALFVRPYSNGYKGEGVCPVAIAGSSEGICLGILEPIDKTEKIQNPDFPDCNTIYSGNGCRGISFFEKWSAVN